MAERVTEIYSLLVPLTEGRLIIPRSCVAEVIGFQTPSEMTGAPPWYIGTVPWNGKAVPLISFRGRLRPTDSAPERPPADRHPPPTRHARGGRQLRPGYE